MQKQQPAAENARRIKVTMVDVAWIALCADILVWAVLFALHMLGK